MRVLTREGQALQRIAGSGLIWDNHICTTLRPGEDRFVKELARCHEAGIDLVSMNIGFGEDGIEPHIRMASFFRDWIARHSEKYRLVLSTKDAAAAKAAGQLGICFDIEGMNALGKQVDMVRLYYDLGVRWMLIAYNRTNPAGAGCMEKEDGGLTAFGRDVIGAMNAVGMILCCTHTGHRTAREAIDASADPMIFSHSNPSAVYDHPRNIPDDLMRACAARGGVIGLNGIGIFLGENDASTETFVRHVEYALDLVGDDHVGIGLDYAFDQEEIAEMLKLRPESFPPGLIPPRVFEEGFRMIEPWRLPQIAQALADRGHTETMLAKLLGGNLMRVAQRVWH